MIYDCTCTTTLPTVFYNIDDHFHNYLYCMEMIVKIKNHSIIMCTTLVYPAADLQVAWCALAVVVQ